MTERQIKLGVNVRTSDGDKVGTVEQIVVDPKTHQPGYLVINYGRLPPQRRSIVAPIGLVDKVSAREVTLETTRGYGSG